MDRVKFSLLDDKERFERLSEAKRKYEDAIKKRSEFLTKAKFGEANTLKEALKNYSKSEVDTDSRFLHNFDNNIEEAKKLKDAISKEKFKEAGIIIPGKEGYYRQPTISRKVRDLAPDVDSLNKMLKISKSGLKLLGMAGVALGAAGYSDPSAAAANIAIPGGLEEIGQNDREVMSDRKYRSANLIPNAGMLGNYTDAPDIGRYHESIRKLQGREM